MSSRFQLTREEDDGLTCRLCLQPFWFREELKKHLTDVHSFTEKDQEEERRRNVQRVMEQRRRIAMAQQQRMQAALGGSGRGIMRGRGGTSITPGMMKPKFSFQYHDGGFICELCKKKFSDGNEMVKHWRTHNTGRGRGAAPGTGRGRGRGRPPMSEGASTRGRGRGRGRGRQKSEKTLRKEERQRKKEEKAKRKANSKRPAWTPYLMWSTRRRKKLMVKHPEWNFAEVSKAISEGWKEVTMEEVERLEEEVFCLNERSKFKAKGKAYWTAFKLWSKRMRKEILEEHPAWTDYAVESALERKWKTVKKEEIDVLENQVTLLSENNEEKVEKGLGNFNAFVCWSIKKMKNIQVNIPNWSDIQIGKSITDGWQEIEKEELEGLDFEASSLNEKVNKRVKKKGKGKRISVDTEEEEEEADEEIGDDEEWDPFILKLKQISKFIDKLETMEELPEQPDESSDEDEKEEAQKSMEVETNEPPKELETKVDNNASIETSDVQENTPTQNGNVQENTEVKEDIIGESISNIEAQALDSQPVGDNPSESLEEKQNGNGEIVEQVTAEQEAVDSNNVILEQPPESTEINMEPSKIEAQVTTEQETVDFNNVILEQPPETTDINMDTSKSDETIAKDIIDKDSQPSLTQSSVEKDVLEDLFQDKSNDDNAADAIVNELPL